MEWTCPKQYAWQLAQRRPSVCLHELSCHGDRDIYTQYKDTSWWISNNDQARWDRALGSNLTVQRVWGVAEHVQQPKINHVYRCSYLICWYLIRDGHRCGQLDVIYYTVVVTQHFKHYGVILKLMIILGFFFHISCYKTALNQPEPSRTNQTQTQSSAKTGWTWLITILLLVRRSPFWRMKIECKRHFKGWGYTASDFRLHSHFDALRQNTAQVTG